MWDLCTDLKSSEEGTSWSSREGNSFIPCTRSPVTSLLNVSIWADENMQYFLILLWLWSHYLLLSFSHESFLAIVNTIHDLKSNKIHWDLESLIHFPQNEFFFIVFSDKTWQVKPLPSVFIFRAVLTKANKVALNMTVPSLFSGIFMATNLCEGEKKTVQKIKPL